MSRSGSLRLPGRLLETASNRRPRGMTTAARFDAHGTEPGLQALFGDFFERRKLGAWEEEGRSTVVPSLLPAPRLLAPRSNENAPARAPGRLRFRVQLAILPTRLRSRRPSGTSAGWLRRHAGDWLLPPMLAVTGCGAGLSMRLGGRRCCVRSESGPARSPAAASRCTACSCWSAGHEPRSASTRACSWAAGP